MVGTTRASRAQQQARYQQEAPPRPSHSQSQQMPQLRANAGTAVPERTAHRGSSDGYATPQESEGQSSQSEPSQLSPTPLPLRQASEARTVATTESHSNEATALGVHMKEIISVINHLESLGLHQQKIQLPKCVVLGEQSSGKSSVIEAISGVRTPRAGGTCTRCPLFISLASSNDLQSPWSARVSLRYNYKFDPFEINGKFPGWAPNLTAQEFEFAQCKTPDKLEEAIRRAQLALVYPLENPADFAREQITPIPEDECQVVNFSPNIVCIQVTQPGLPNLSFYDLPGLISQSENPTDVRLVKQLVQDYVQDPDALVLVACSLAADIATSIASGLARNEWEAGERCIGVLTKPDLLPAGSSDTPLYKVLNGMELKFGHGYFVVKNPDQLMLNNHLTHKDAREQEHRFFATIEPWCSRLHNYQSRFGTAHLQQYLSEQLANLMLKALPTIDAQVKGRLNEIDFELKQIPEPPPSHSAVRIISDLLNDFSNNVRKELEAEYPCKTWVSLWRDIQQRFYDALLEMRPLMRTNGLRDQGLYKSTLPGQSSHDPVCLDEDDYTGSVQHSPPETPQKKRKLEGTPGPTPTKKPHSIKASTVTPSKGKANGHSYVNFRTVYKLDEVAQHLSEYSITKIRDQIQPMVINDMIKLTLQKWPLLLTQLFDDLERELKGYIRGIFDQYFGTRSDTKLYTEAWRIVEDVFNTSMAEQRFTLAADVLGNELEGPYIFHQKKFDDAKNLMRQKYTDARFNARLKLYMQEMEEHVGAGKAPTEERLRKDEKIRSQITKEPYEIEIDVVARITSYYALAADRFHDAICMGIEGKPFKRLRTKLRDEMHDTLDIHGIDKGARRAMELLEEPSHHADRRRQLIAMRNALLEGQACLDRLKAKHDNSIDTVQSANGFASLGQNSGPLALTTGFTTDEMEGIMRSRY